MRYKSTFLSGSLIIFQSNINNLRCEKSWIAYLISIKFQQSRKWRKSSYIREIRVPWFISLIKNIYHYCYSDMSCNKPVYEVSYGVLFIYFSMQNCYWFEFYSKVLLSVVYRKDKFVNAPEHVGIKSKDRKTKTENHRKS